MQFIDSLPEEHNEDLEEEYDNYFKKHEMDIVLNPYTNCKDIARHFAEWQKKKMIKDAVNGTVCHRNGNIGDIYFQSDSVLSAKYPFKYAERIKIIIVKEEQQ